MRDDYTYNGLPVSKMKTEDIVDILNEGGCHINDDDGLGSKVAEERVMARLRLELDIRRMGLRV